MADKGYTAATESSLPLKLMDDLSLLHDAETLKYYNEVTVDDWGYNIHFTSYSNTAGCIGVKDKKLMKNIIFWYKLNEKFDPKSSTITVNGVEE